MRFIGNFIAGENEKEWIKFTCQRITETIKEKLKTFDYFNLAISGGNTPKLIFEELISNEYLSQSEWTKVSFFWVDERIVAIESEDSNYGNAMNYLSKLPSKFFQMYDESIGIELSIEKYEEKLKEIKFENQFPKFDLIILGMGDDGHTASLFPKSKGLEESKKWICLNYVEKLDSNRLTLTFPVIKNAEEILILFNGNDKKAIINDIILGVGDYPIEKILDSKTPKTWLYF